MKAMKAQGLRELGQTELVAKERELKEELFNLKFQLGIGQLENTSRIRAVKRDIARVATVLRESKGSQA
jgi:large subunit ribosomal protein L29